MTNKQDGKMKDVNKELSNKGKTRLGTTVLCQACMWAKFVEEKDNIDAVFGIRFYFRIPWGTILMAKRSPICMFIFGIHPGPRNRVSNPNYSSN